MASNCIGVPMQQMMHSDYSQLTLSATLLALPLLDMSCNVEVIVFLALPIFVSLVVR